MTNSIGELENARAILVIGSNTAEQHPIIAGRILNAVRSGASLVIYDPRRLPLSPYAEMHLAHRPGTDAACLNAMMKVIIDEKLYRSDFIRERTEGYEELEESLRGCTPEWASAISGVPADDIARSARIFAGAPDAAIVYCMGITQHVSGTDNVRALANLCMLTGNVGRPSTGLNPLRGQNNVQGACDTGCLPDVLPGYQKVADQGCREKFEMAWGSIPAPEPGLTLMEMMEAARRGEIEFMYIMGENPVLSDPNSSHAREALDRVGFLVVQDIMDTGTTRLADAVLPAACWAEKDGTFTSTERRVQRVRKAVDPPGDALADGRLICMVARELGARGFEYDSMSEVFDEMAGLTPSYGGISWERLGSEGIQWPCPEPGHPGTPLLHRGAFARGKGKFHPVEYRPPAEEPDTDYPFILMTGRLAFHYHTGTMSRSSPTLERELDRAHLEINPADAKGLGVEDGLPVRVKSRRGEITLPVRVTAGIQEGCVFAPFHFAESPVNELTSDFLDPESRIPELKVCAVRLEVPDS